MKCSDILYIHDSAVYLKRNNIIVKLISNEIKDYIILNPYQFLKNYIKFLKDNKLSTIIFYRKLIFIYDDLCSIYDISELKSFLKSIGYLKIIFIKDSDIPSNDTYIINANKYIKLYYKDKFNQKKKLVIDINNLSTFEIRYLIYNKIKNKELYIIGENNYINRIISSLTSNYYLINDKNFLINNIR